jgi:hypothetical protein
MLSPSIERGLLIYGKCHAEDFVRRVYGIDDRGQGRASDSNCLRQLPIRARGNVWGRQASERSIITSRTPPPVPGMRAMVLDPQRARGALPGAWNLAKLSRDTFGAEHPQS